MAQNLADTEVAAGYLRKVVHREQQILGLYELSRHLLKVALTLELTGEQAPLGDGLIARPDGAPTRRTVDGRSDFHLRHLSCCLGEYGSHDHTSVGKGGNSFGFGGKNLKGAVHAG